MDQSQNAISNTVKMDDGARRQRASLSPGQLGTDECTTGSIVAERYEVLGALGSGGMSTVYKVRHVHLEKVFAMKVLHDASAEAVQRFQIEGKASTLLDHRNIVKVHDFGIHDGHSYMILDYVEGQSLAQLLDIYGALEPRRALRIIAQICSALAHAHEQGVIHRDIKPNNIVIQNLEGAIEHVVVLDFGIAKLTKQDKTCQSLTRTGDVFGTPLYMSPEQCQSLPVDARTDIYALGCVIYETLTGNPPFLGQSAYETIHKQLTEAPPPFPAALRKSAIGRQLEPIVLKALAKLPQNRHKFMLQLASELKQVEVGATGGWGDLASSWRLFMGRMNAVERSQVMLRTGLQGTSVLAALLMVLILGLPSLHRATLREYDRNSAVILSVDQIIKDRLTTASLSFSELELEEAMRLVRRFCLGDPEELKLADELAVAAGKARTSSRQIVEHFKTLIFLPDGADKIKSVLTRVVQKWATATSISSELSSVAFAKKTQAQQQMQLFSKVFDAAKIAGVLIELALAVLLCRSFLNAGRRHAPEPNEDIQDNHNMPQI